MEENKNKLKKTLKGSSLGFIDVLQNRDVWNEIAHELNREFKVKLTTGNIIECHTLSIPYKKWAIVFSISDTRPLKINISFLAHTDFEMTLSWEDLTDKILKKLGKHEITLGWDLFDKKYLINSNMPGLLKELITADVQKLFLKYNIYSLSYQPYMKNSSAELMCVIQRNVGSKEMITELVDMFKSMLDKLKQQKIIE
jgi:hypothetical protein